MALLIEMVRTALYRRNEVGVQAPYEPCVRCGKPVLPQGAARLELLVGGEILPVGDPRSGGAGSQGRFPIGPDCARALGSKYVLPYLKELPEDAPRCDHHLAKSICPACVATALATVRAEEKEAYRELLIDDGQLIFALRARVTALERVLREIAEGEKAAWTREAMAAYARAALAPGAGGTA